MKMTRYGICVKSVIWFMGAAFSLVGLVGASWVGSSQGMPISSLFTRSYMLSELGRLALLQSVPKTTIESLIRHQRLNGKTLAQILRDPHWCKKLGYSQATFKATWYAANPFDLLPRDLQKALQKNNTPFRSSNDLWNWCQTVKAPAEWRTALKIALIETTAANLWRAAHGQEPYTKSGDYLKPIVVDGGGGKLKLFDGHIATDPRVIPTNTEVLLLVKVNGEEKVLRVRATDVGSAIKGYHVDLPIYLNKDTTRTVLPYIRFPSEYIANATVTILMPIRKLSPSQKA